MTFQKQYGTGLREAPKWPFRLEEYRASEVMVETQSARIVMRPGDRFPRITVDGVELDYTRYTLTQKVGGPARLVVEVLVK